MKAHDMKTNKKLTTNEFKSRAVTVHGDRFSYENCVYESMHKKVIIGCSIHGEFEQTPLNHLNGQQCPQCAQAQREESKRLGVSEWKEKFTEKHANKYDYSLFTSYKNAKDKIKIICPVHGEFEQSIAEHAYSGGCRLCGVVKRISDSRITQQDVLDKFKSAHGDRYGYDFVKVFDSETPVRIVCKDHGEFLQSPSSHYRGSGCPVCARDIISSSRKLDISEVIRLFRSTHGNKFDYDRVVYTGYSENVIIICPTHGEFEQTPDNHIHGEGCPKCACLGKSKPELDLYDVVTSYNPDVIHGDRKLLEGKELDVYDPEYKLAFEFNGLYWHSSGRCEDDKEMEIYHLEKTESCALKGVRLFHIFENEWRTKRKIWESVIRNAYGYSKRVHARKCEIREVDHKESEQFLIESHLQGSCLSSFRYGLFYQGELVSLMTFGASRFNKKYDFELLRFCNKINTTVVGGASKLLKAFRSEHKGAIISYANRRWSDGGLYSSLGFTELQMSGPGYYYVDKRCSTVHHRSAFMKHKLKEKLGNFNSELSEVENMYDNGYRRIWDSGNFVFVLE